VHIHSDPKNESLVEDQHAEIVDSSVQVLGVELQG
jgi:hypothetical protein